MTTIYFLSLFHLSTHIIPLEALNMCIIRLVYFSARIMDWSRHYSVLIPTYYYSVSCSLVSVSTSNTAWPGLSSVIVRNETIFRKSSGLLSSSYTCSHYSVDPGETSKRTASYSLSTAFRVNVQEMVYRWPFQLMHKAINASIVTSVRIYISIFLSIYRHFEVTKGDKRAKMRF